MDEFTAHATAIGSVILSELSLPASNKTHKPVDAGGIAGGNFMRFVCEKAGKAFLVRDIKAYSYCTHHVYCPEHFAGLRKTYLYDEAK